jgi:dTDP-4-amino-4,6-dideoxygalactose transaminase
MRLWTLNGQTKDAFSKSQVGGWRYDILFQGLKINMPDLCAAVGLAQLRKYDDVLLRQREKVARQYESFFEKKQWAQSPLLEDANRKSCFHLFPLRIKDISEEERDRIINYISSNGVSVNVHFIPMPMLTVFKELGYKIEHYPVAYDNYSREISLPIYPQLSTDQIQYICDTVEEAYHSIK